MQRSTYVKLSGLLSLVLFSAIAWGILDYSNQDVKFGDVDFQTASNQNRLRLPRNTTVNLDALSDVSGLLAYDTTLNLPVYNNGSGWSVIGQGDVVGPASSTDDAIAVFDGTTGKLLQNSAITISGNDITVPGQISGGSLGLGTPLSVANGGTGITSGTSGGVPYFSADGIIQSSGALTANQIVLGGGAGSAPIPLGSLGTTTTVLHGNAGGAPTFGAVSLTADVSGALPIANGGTNKALTLSAGGVPYFDADSFEVLNAGTAGFVLTSGGSSAPTWAAAPSGSGINMLGASNPKAESGVETPWTETGGGTLTVTNTAANVANGTWAFSYDASAGTDTADSPAITIPAGLFGQNCLLEFRWKGFDNTMAFEVYDGSTVIASYAVPAAATNYKIAQINFTCPSSGTLQMRLNPSGDTAIGYWDEVHLGSATNVSSTTVTSEWTRSTSITTTGFGTPTSIEVYTRRVGDTLEMRGKYIAGTTTAASASFDIPSGLTIDTSKISTATNVGYIGDSINSTSGGSVSVSSTDKTPFLFFDGSDTNSIFFGYQAGGADLDKVNGNTLWASGDLIAFKMAVPIANWGNGTTITDQTVRTPTVQVLTSGSSATYTRPAGVTHLHVRMVGGGGGGGGGGTGSPGAGTNGTATTFACTAAGINWSAGGGQGGGNGGAQNGGNGGTNTFTGGIGQSLAGTYGAHGTGATTGGIGGVSPFGGGGSASSNGIGGSAAIANSGSGGGGGSASTNPGGGGGSGGYIDGWIISPDPTCTYTIGAKGTAGTAGTGAGGSADGATGVIYVTEYYGMNAPVIIGWNTQYDCTASGPTGWSTVSCKIVPYVTSNGTWRARFNINGTKNSAAQARIIITGVTFPTYRQSVSCADDSGNSASQNCFADDGNSHAIELNFASANTSVTTSGDVELAAKPTFVP